MFLTHNASDTLSKYKQDLIGKAKLFNEAPSSCLSCLTKTTVPAACVYQCVSVNSQLPAPIFLLSSNRLCVCVCVCSSTALQHHDNHMDLHGPGVRPCDLSGHHHLQETARLHFTTLPIAAVCGTLSYTTLSCLSVCNVACDEHCVNCISTLATCTLVFGESKMRVRLSSV